MADGSQPMHGKLTSKQEAFVAAFIESGNASAAYRQAYDCSGMSEPSINQNASKLLKHAKIAPRLRELQERAAAKVVLTRAWVLERLMKNAEKGHTNDDLQASNKALELLGKTDELAMFVERSNVTSDNRHTHAAEPLSPFAQFLVGTIGVRAEGETEGPLQN